MITTRMSVKEVFKEFEKDKDLVYSRFNGFVHANKKSLLRIQKQKGKDFWIPCKGVRFRQNNSFYMLKLFVSFHNMSTTGIKDGLDNSVVVPLILSVA